MGIKSETAPEWVLELAQLWSPQGEWTEEEYFALPDTNRFIELSEGALIMPPHPTHSHQQAVLRLAMLMYEFVQACAPGGIVQVAPLPVRLWPGKIREPDIIFVAREHRDRAGEQFYGPPDLVVEVLSPGTWRVDRREKMVEYAQAGIDEYWLVDPEVGTVEVFVLRQGAYALLDKWGRGESARSRRLDGFEVLVDEVVGEIGRAHV
jgi:Uma2 family endonuclease